MEGQSIRGKGIEEEGRRRRGEVLAQHQGRGAGVLPREREREKKKKKNKTEQEKKRAEQTEILGRQQGREIQQGKSNRGGVERAKEHSQGH